MVAANKTGPFENPRLTAQRHACLNIFAAAVKSSLSAPSDIERACCLFKAGANASDALCFAWFAQLDGARRTSQEARDTIAGLGALTNAIQVLTGVEPNPIGIASATFTQAGLATESLQRNDLLPADLAVIYDAVKTFRERTFLDYLGAADGKASAITNTMTHTAI